MHSVFAQISPDAIKSVPEIIRAASASTLGVIALIVLVLGALAYVFFKNAPQTVKVVIFAMLFFGLVGYAAAIAFTDKSAVSHFVGRVKDKATESPIRAAKVSLEIQDAPPVTYTDSEGVYSFWVRRLAPGLDGRIRVEADGFQSFDRILSIESGNRIEDIRLQSLPLVAAAPQPESPPKSTRPQPSKVAKEPVPAPPPPRCDAVEVHSGPQISGVGKGWSGWYPVKAGPSPEGCAVAKVEFWLTGDRQCGAWAECQETARTDASVGYQFRLQGHEERFPGQEFSEGHLRVSYQRK